MTKALPLISRFSPAEKLLFLRFSRLNRTPPAAYSAQLLRAAGLPMLVVEYGEIREPMTRIEGEVPRLRLEAPWVAGAPGRLRAFLIWLTAMTRLARSFLHGERPRLIVAHGLPEQAMAYLLARMTGVPYAAHVHEIYERGSLRGLNRLFLALEGKALRRAEFLIFSEATRADVYRERYRLKRPLFIVANCPPLRTARRTDALRRRLAVPDDAKILLYVGGIGPRNAIREVVEAMAPLPFVHLCLIGWAEGGYRAEVDAQAQRVGLGPRLHWLGEVDPATKWEALDGSDAAYCYYQPDELRTRHLATASNKLMEALAAGIPVLARATEDFRDVVERHDVGICAASTEPAELTRALRLLLGDELGRCRRGQNGADLHQRYFHFERQFAAVLTQYREWFPAPGSEARSG